MHIADETMTPRDPSISAARWLVAVTGIVVIAFVVASVISQQLQNAIVSRTGQLPVGTGDGVAFYARSDDAGNAFDGRCTFVISGSTPAARYWTLTLYDAEGRPVANTIDRHGFTSAEIVREADGRLAISVAPRARPGNWLPTGGIEQFVLVWRLYDTPIGVATRTTKSGPMPAVARKDCS